MADEVKKIRVRATKVGFINKLIHEGEEFDVPEHLVSKKWMEIVEVKPEERRDERRTK